MNLSVSGYNVTILAYGQTGSGKTYTMGTNYAINNNKGIIPRAVDDIFETVKKDSVWEFKIKASFIEVSVFNYRRNHLQ